MFTRSQVSSCDAVSEEPTQTDQVDQETLPSSGPSGQPEVDTPELFRSARAKRPRFEPVSSASDEEISVDDVGSHL